MGDLVCFHNRPPYQPPESTLCFFLSQLKVLENKFGPKQENQQLAPLMMKGIFNSVTHLVQEEKRNPTPLKFKLKSALYLIKFYHFF